jgi:hypothetical protein
MKQKIVSDFIDKSSPFWDGILHQDKDFLIHHVTSVFPDSKYVRDISFFFGNNADEKIYIEDEDTLQYLWDILKGMVSLSLKYLHYSGIPSKVNVADEMVKWNITV